MFLLGIEKIAFGLATIYEIWLHVPSIHSIHCRERTKIISKGLKIKHTLTGYFKWFIS